MDEWLFLPEQNKNWVTLVLGFNFILFVLIKVRFEQQFFSFIRLIDTPMYFNIYGEKKFISQGFTYVSGLFSLINLVLLLCFLIQPFTQTPSFNLFLILLISIGAVLILRQSILLFLGLLLDLNGFVNQYQFRNLTYLFRLSILLFIGIIVYYYSFNQSAFFLQGVSITLIFIYFLVQLIVIKQLINIINKGGLYFILYLCVLKISPWIILIRGLKQIL